jgi:hypothetical protein
MCHVVFVASPRVTRRITLHIALPSFFPTRSVLRNHYKWAFAQTGPKRLKNS